jgi:hypothetical protein
MEPPLGTYVLELPPDIETTGSRRLLVQLRPATPDATR